MKKYKIFTFGGTGRNIAHTLVSNNKSLYEEQEHILYHFNTDKQSVDSSTLLINKYTIGKTGLGAGSNIENAKKAFDDYREVFDGLTNDDLFYILIGSFSGGTGGGFLIKISELLTQKRKKFVIIGSLPFHFEGTGRLQQSYNVIEILKRTTDNIIILPYQNLVSSFGGLSLSTAFTMADYYVIEVISSILGIGSWSIDEQVSNILLNDIEISTTIRKIKNYFNENNLIYTTNSKIIIPDTNYELLKALTIDYNLIYTISPRRFEEMIEYIYRKSGYETVLNKHTRDNGVDIIVYTPPPIFGNNFITVVQAKRYHENNKVGVSTVRDLLGAKIIFNADNAQIITTSDFSKPAQKVAQKENIDLIKFEEFNCKIQELLRK